MLGDLDHDGLGELLIGAPTADGPGEETGAAILVFGADIADRDGTTHISNAYRHAYVGLTDEAHFGSVLAAPGDLTLDSQAIAQPRHSYLQSRRRSSANRFAAYAPGSRSRRPVAG